MRVSSRCRVHTKNSEGARYLDNPIPSNTASSFVVVQFRGSSDLWEQSTATTSDTIPWRKLIYNRVVMP